MDNQCNQCNWCLRLLNQYNSACKKCKYVRYCDSYCRNLDAPGHSLICYPDVGDRIIAYAQVLLKYKSVSTNISAGIPITIDHTSYNFRAIRQTSACGLCHDSGHLRFTQEFIPGIYHYVCSDCYGFGWKLCPNTGLIGDACVRKRHECIKKFVLLRYYFGDASRIIIDAIICDLKCNGIGCSQPI